MGKILILSHSCEDGTDDVIDYLNELKAPWVRVNLDQLVEDIRCSWSLDSSIDVPTTSLSLFSQACSIEDITTIWCRRGPMPPALPGLSLGEEIFVRREVYHFWPAVFNTLDTCFWVNHWRAAQVTKPEQLSAAQNAGLLIPPTLMSNDPIMVRGFINKYGPAVIAKPISNGTVGYTYDVVLAKGNNSIPYIFSQLIRLDDIDDRAIFACPSLYQAFVKKDREIRVTMIGDKIFSVAMDTKSDPGADVDWRLAGDIFAVAHEIHSLPVEVEKSIREMMRNLNLVFGVMDFILSPDGKYTFLEVNTSGQWGWTETKTGLPITRTLAELLHSYT